MATKAEQKRILQLWRQYKNAALKVSPVDYNESISDKQKRIARLEKNPEKWFAYYFPNFYTAEPAPFHIAASRRVINNPEWYEVRSWSRELAKSVRTMMEVMYLTLTGKKKNVLMVSDTEDSAKRLLLPYRANLEFNERIIHDYGVQRNIGQWEDSEFVTTKGVSFRALGAKQSPRGTRNDADRPDVILIDDIDTDEEVRNPQRVSEKVKWIESALYGTRSIHNPLLWIANGNIIAKYCAITEMGKRADKWEIINIRDKNGKSTWPAKNSEADIDRALSKISWAAAQKEYFNNPISEGDVFKEIIFDRLPPLKRCDAVIAYADPATSNKDRGKSRNKQASHKAVAVIGKKGRKIYVYKIWLDQTGNATFVDWLYEAYLYMKEGGVDVPRIYIENNTLQDPFYQQVLLPLIKERGDIYGISLPIKEDKRKKSDKFFRIEGTLEPLNRLGNLLFNKKEKDNPHMQRLEEQMLGVNEKAVVMDGPDAVEGGVWLLNNKAGKKRTAYAVGKVASRKY